MEYEDYNNKANETLKDGELFYLQTIEGIGKLWITILWVSVTIFLSLYDKLEDRGVDLKLFFYLWLFFLLSSVISMLIRYFHSESLFRYSRIYENEWWKSLTNDANFIWEVTSVNKKLKRTGDNFTSWWKKLYYLSTILFIWWLVVLIRICYQITY